MRKRKPARRRFHVVWRKRDKCWSVHEEGASWHRMAFVKRLAVDMGRFDAWDAQPSSLYIHRKDGTIQEERSYPRGSDPFPPKG